MSLFGDTIDRAIAALPPKKDPYSQTCRSKIYDGIAVACGWSEAGSPWAVEVEVALHNLCLAVDRAIDTDPVLKEIFDRPPRQFDEDGTPVIDRQGDGFGLCPHCHRMDGYANAGRSHRAYCKKHKVSWVFGANLVDSWKDQTEEEQRAIWAGIGLNTFEDVEPFFWPETLARAEKWHNARAIAAAKVDLDAPVPF